MNSPEFTVKLLSGNLILVEAQGYTSEIFKPYVQNGKIHVFNMVPCKENPPPKVAVYNRKILGDILIKPKLEDSKKIRVLENIPLNISYNSCFNQSATSSQNNSLIGDSKQSATVKPTVNNVTNKENCFATPKPIKTYSRKQNQSLENRPAIATPMLGPNVKVVRLHRKSTPNTPKRVGRIVSTNSPSSCTSSPLYNRSPRRQIHRIQPPGTVTKWRNCITPQRTYSRFARAKHFSPGFLRRHRNAVHYNLLRPSTTQPYFGEMFVQLKKVPTILDDKVKISPVRFKRQLQNWSDITKTEDDEYVPKTKLDYRHTRDSFTLMTSCTKHKCYGERLQRLFKRKCVLRRARTERSFLRFVEMEAIPPLEEDEDEEELVRPRFRRELILD